MIDVLWEKDEGKRREFFRMGREWSLEGGREGGRGSVCERGGRPEQILDC